MHTHCVILRYENFIRILNGDSLLHSLTGQKAISISGCADAQTSAGTGKGPVKGSASPHELKDFEHGSVSVELTST